MKSLTSLKTELSAKHGIGQYRPGALPRALGLIALISFATTSWSQPTHPALEVVLKTLDAPDSFAKDFETKVWLMDMSTRLSKFIKDPEDRFELLQLVYKEAKQADLPPELILALIHTESTFDQYAVSSAGAQGLMQIMPFWKYVIGQKQDNLLSLQTNIRYGVEILRHYLEKENGDLTRALARYNGSLGKTWYPERVFTNLERHWQ
ncbi:lytic transglycosylase domain-containing protein [Endozoicomonas sp.]|uniref:lytic transglycosylase domain-containing protein n=1 Tax=Endozoicomonas sp. TaxID=1892382 RepID=UPI0028884DF3|nr:lytic transglycosylase domain-containing protein [Endozoicomonas sp.]